MSCLRSRKTAKLETTPVASKRELQRPAEDLLLGSRHGEHFGCWLNFVPCNNGAILSYCCFVPSWKWHLWKGFLFTFQLIGVLTAFLLIKLLLFGEIWQKREPWLWQGSILSSPSCTCIICIVKAGDGMTLTDYMLRCLIMLTSRLGFQKVQAKRI